MLYNLVNKDRQNLNKRITQTNRNETAGYSKEKTRDAGERRGEGRGKRETREKAKFGLSHQGSRNATDRLNPVRRPSI
jgi:hypothetical protein